MTKLRTWSMPGLLSLVLVLCVPGALPGAPATLSHVFGRVERRPGETASWQRARQGEELAVGSQLRTLRGARAELRLAGGELLRLEERSHLCVPRSKHNRPERISVVRLFLGSLWCRVEKLARGESFQVHTPTAVGGVKGTLFVVDHDEMRGETSMALLEGSMQVLARNPRPGRPASLLLRPGTAVRVGRRSGLGRPRPVDVAALRKRFEGFGPDLRGDGGRDGDGGPDESFLVRLRREVEMEERCAVQVRRLALRMASADAARKTRFKAMIDRFVADSARRGGAVAAMAGARMEAASPELLRLLKRFRSAQKALRAAARGEVDATRGDAGEGAAVPAEREPRGEAVGSDADREGQRTRMALGLVCRRIEGLEARLRGLPVGPPAPKPPLKTFVRTFLGLEREGRRLLNGLERGGDGGLSNDFERARRSFLATLRKVEELVKQRYADSDGPVRQ